MSVSKQYLSIHDHSRELSGLKYIYSVVSRRAGGLSVGINLNVNNACNWQCIYCEIPNLTRGTPPPIELDVLENELRFFLHEIIHGDNDIVKLLLDAGVNSKGFGFNSDNNTSFAVIDNGVSLPI
jgi:sulfatase maturation enzyme AslB (radical SAM superfamily)